MKMCGQPHASVAVPQVRTPITIVQEAERAPEPVWKFRSLLLGFESKIVQPVHYAISLVHKNVPSPRPSKQVARDAYSNATRICLLTLTSSDNHAHGAWMVMYLR